MLILDFVLVLVLEGIIVKMGMKRRRPSSLGQDSPRILGPLDPGSGKSISGSGSHSPGPGILLRNLDIAMLWSHQALPSRQLQGD